MKDQEKREKVIKGLECCKGEGIEGTPICEECPYANHPEGTCDRLDTLFDDILALLKAQEARVLTLEETLNCLVIEYRSGKLQEVGKRVFTEGNEYYGSIWRVWDRMPTDEQREETPWN